MVRLKKIADLANKFVLVRLLRIEGADLSLFDFDYDLTWMGFFLNANEKILGRYGGRDASDSEARLSLPGLRYAMTSALATHRLNPQAKSPKRGPADFLRNYSAAKNYGGCIHCHQVKEIRRADLKLKGKWKRDRVWVYPLPENIGVTLDKNQGDLVRKVRPKSPAHAAGLQSGDIIERVNEQTVHSFADFQYALHRAPKVGKIKLSWRRSKTTRSAEITLHKGWRKTNLTWRPSLLDLLPSLPLFGEDLTAKEKQKLGLAADRLAFRQENPVPTHAKRAGLRPGDIVIGIDDKKLHMDVVEFLGYVRRNYLIGDRVSLNLMRGGKPVDVSLTLR